MNNGYPAFGKSGYPTADMAANVGGSLKVSGQGPRTGYPSGNSGTNGYPSGSTALVMKCGAGGGYVNMGYPNMTAAKTTH